MTDASDQCDVLFVAERSPWPLDQGFKVHGYHMSKALHAVGANIRFASIQAPSVDEPADLAAMHVDWPTANAHQVARFGRLFQGTLGRARRRLFQHLGPDTRVAAGILPLVEQVQPKLVVGLGIHSPLILAGIDDRYPCKRVWYAADELLYFHLSCMSHERVSHWPRRLSQAFKHLAMERLFASRLDGAIGVSPHDTTWLQHVAGVRDCALIRNGVDLDRFAPQENVVDTTPCSLVFWGSLDFEPHVDAVCWCTKHVWPRLRFHRPNAVWRIAGRNPVAAVRALSTVSGIDVVGPVDDVSDLAHQCSAVVLPMRCGGGIKNKLLEAAAMGRPTVVSPRAVAGLAFDHDDCPFPVCRTVDDWVMAIRRVWNDAHFAGDIGKAGRRWVEQYHDWHDAARHLLSWQGVVVTSNGESSSALAA